MQNNKNQLKLSRLPFVGTIAIKVIDLFDWAAISAVIPALFDPVVLITSLLLLAVGIALKQARHGKPAP